MLGGQSAVTRSSAAGGSSQEKPAEQGGLFREKRQMLEQAEVNTIQRQSKAGELPLTLESSFSKDALDWYNARCKKGRFEPFSGLETLTVDRAEVLWAVNEENRNLSPACLADICRDIRNKAYRLNGETVVVSSGGLLNDGQHRVRAVIETGIPIRTFMVFGVDRDSRRTLDTGRARTTGNFISMEGGKHANRASQVAFWLLMHRLGLFEQNGTQKGIPTKSEVIAYWFQNAETIEEAINVVRIKNALEMRSSGPLATAFVLISRVNPNGAREFFSKLCEGGGYEIGSPIHRLRSRIIEMQGARLRPGQKIGLIIRGWNAHCRGVRQVKTLQIPTEFPKIEG